MNIPYIPHNIAQFYSNLSSIGWASFAGFFLWFVLIFTEKKSCLKKWYTYLLIFVPGIILILYQWLYQFDQVYYSKFGWYTVFNTSLITYLYIFYVLAYIILSLSLLIVHSYRIKDFTRKHQIKIIIFSTLITLILGSFSGIILQKFFLVEIPDISNMCLLIWALGLVYAIEKYRFLVITPALASDNIIATMTDALLLIDTKGKIIKVNQAFLNLFGYAQEEIEGHLIRDLLKEKKYRQIKLYEYIKKSPVNNLNLTIKTKQKEHKIINFSSSLLKDKTGIITGIVGIAQDITRQKHAEQELKKSNSNLFSLMDSAVNFVIYSIKIDKKAPYKAQVIFVSPSIKILLGIKDPHNYSSWFKNIHPEDLNKVVEANEHAQRTGGLFNQTFRIYHRYRKKYCWIQAVSTPVLNQKKEPVAYNGIMIDITQQIELQEQLIQSEKFSEIGQLTAGIAHEFNNILAIISGNAQLIKADNENKMELFESLDIIEKEVKRGANIVKNMNAFAKPKPLHLELIDITAIINQTISIMKKQLQLENIKIITDFKKHSPLLIDSSQFQQVFLNLLINARDAIRPKRKGIIKIFVKEINNNVEIHFSDTGIGINEAIKDKIFSPFFTTKGARAQDKLGIKGTGLGLSVSYAIIQKHKGTITVNSQVGTGTTFIITLPVAQQEHIASLKKEIISYDRIRKIKDLKILIADDEITIITVLQKLLTRAGYFNIVTATKGKKAVDYFMKEKFDVAFLDILMPDINGEELFLKIKEIDAHIPVIFISGQLGLEEIKLKKMGAYAFVQKPFTIEKILHLLYEVSIKKK